MNIKTIGVFFIVLLFTGGGLWYFNAAKQPQDLQNPPEMMVEQTDSRYIPYSASVFAQNSDKKRVLYFHAPWCPTCKVANQEFTQNASQIPSDVVLFKTDYDSEKELKTKYEITYQHTFVLVDEAGNEIKKWNGGGIKELVLNINNL